MTVRVTLNCPLKQSSIVDLLPFLAENLPNVRAFDGNKRVNIFIDKANNEMLIDEDWSSPEHHQRYMEFISNNGIMEQLAAFLTLPPTIKYFDQVDI
ncbi:putative quinol monooxygenase [Kiloniella antarctica]|uniref:Quinol monooxygenase n=1 Tax=Kiloniella antarctica TaxID=1550907 RepID=A0ABW5BL40_9PROT